MVINSPCLTDKKELAIPGQTETGKEFSNPLMAGSLPKTISAKTSVPIKLRADEAVNQEEGDRVERAITTDARLETIHDSDNITKTQTTTMPNVDIPQGIDIGGRPRCQETMGGTSTQTRSDRVLEQPNEPPLTKGHTYVSREGRLEENIEQMDIVSTPHDLPCTRGYTPGSDKGRITLAELMEACTIMSNKRSLAKDKGKEIMQETELPKKLKKKEMIQLSLDEELAQKLYAKELAKEEARQEQERYNLEKIFRNRPFSKAEVRNNMIMYLKNQGGYKQSYFKRMKYEDIKPLFKRIWDQVHTFVAKDSEIKKEVMKRAGFDLHQGSSKKQRLDQQTEETEEEVKAQGDSDQEVEELKHYMRIIPEEDIAIKAIPLAVKPPMIIEYKEGKISTYHNTRADGSTRRYTSMINLLENINRDDLETLWKLVKDKYGNTRPEEGYERVLWGDLKVMFEPNIERCRGNYKDMM
nr:hypothetical protein [Tanacetum cinerariifolium]